VKKLLILFLLLLVTACQSKPVTGDVISVEDGSYRNINAEELAAMLKNKDFVFINVHIPFAGNIVDTDLSIPYDEIEQNLSRLPNDKNAEMVLYCRSGRMSEIAAEKLVSLGYTNIWNLKGGLVAREQVGYEIDR
jgi:rhodanese-related sulfurtransferase